MKSRKLLYQIILIVIVLKSSACTEVIPIEFPDHQPRLVINSIAETGMPWEMQVSVSKSLNDDIFYHLPNNANVELFKGGELVEKLQHAELGMYRSIETKPEPEQEYSILVSVPGYEPCSASFIMPSIPELHNPIFRSIDFHEHHTTEFRVTIEDIAATEDFYFVRVYHRDEHYDIIRYDSDLKFYDPVAQEHGLKGDIIFPDLFFNGKNFELAFSFFTVPGLEYFIEIGKHTDDYYQYVKTYNFNINIDEAVFSERKKVHNNIINGFGIFAGYSSQVFIYKP
ncbi:MAG: DUF4249 domain-containing protein [Bacteroidota bacterium]|nr:DUF4249 domain-containing protein [Bacteroidota bacterium]